MWLGRAEYVTAKRVRQTAPHAIQEANPGLVEFQVKLISAFCCDGSA